MAPVSPNNGLRGWRWRHCAALVVLWHALVWPSGLFAQVPSPDARVPSRAPASAWARMRTIPRSPPMTLENCWTKSGIVYHSNAAGKLIEQKPVVECVGDDWTGPTYVQWTFQPAPAGAKTKYLLTALPSTCTNNAVCANNACHAVQKNWCWIDNKGRIVASDAQGRVTQVQPAKACLAADWLSPEYQQWSCSNTLVFSTTKQKKLQMHTKTCADGELCAAASCQPAPYVCLDADHAGPTALFVPPVGVPLPSPTIPSDQPQILTPSFVTLQQGALPPQPPLYDTCKGPALREMICTDTMTPFQEVTVKCPDNFTCKTKGVIGPDGFPAVAAYCGLSCPFGDACPSEPGCGPCTTLEFPDPCTPLDTTQSYPFATIVNSTPPHLDTCFDTNTVQHHLCENGIAAYPQTNCLLGATCANGQCDGQDAPEPPDPNTTPKACEDLDPPPSEMNLPPGQSKDSGTHGGTHTFGQLLLNGVVVPEAQDACVSKKLLKQFTCAGAGYTSALDTCTFSAVGNPEECLDGVCKEIVNACACDEFSPNNGVPGFTKGMNKFGEAFNLPDTCSTADAHFISHAACNQTIAQCHDPAVDVPCPAGTVCKNNICQLESQASCSGPSAEPPPDKFIKQSVSGTDQTGVPFVNVPDQCLSDGTRVRQVWCDVGLANGYALGEPEYCALALCDAMPDPTACQAQLCVDGACVSCVDSDPADDPAVPGFAADLLMSHGDLCNTEGKLTQVTCSPEGTLVIGEPMPCPNNGECQLDHCVPPPVDLCAGKDLAHPTDQCQIGTCDAATGIISFANKPIVDDNDACTQDSCDPATGNPVHTALAFDPAGNACQDETPITAITLNANVLTLCITAPIPWGYAARVQPGNNKCPDACLFGNPGDSFSVQIPSNTTFSITPGFTAGKWFSTATQNISVGGGYTATGPYTTSVMQFSHTSLSGENDIYFVKNDCVNDPHLTDIAFTIDAMKYGHLVIYVAATNGSTPPYDLCKDKSLTTQNLCEIGACDSTTGIMTYAQKPIDDDNNPCTIDSCDPATGAVTHTVKNDLPECAPLPPQPQMTCKDGAEPQWSPVGVENPLQHLQGATVKKMLFDPKTGSLMATLGGTKVPVRLDPMTQTWEAMSIPDSNNSAEMVITPDKWWLVLHDFIAQIPQSNFYYSSDAGATWTQASALTLVAPDGAPTDVTHLFYSQGYLYAVKNSPTGFFSFVFRSADGISWATTNYSVMSKVVNIFSHTTEFGANTYLINEDGNMWHLDATGDWAADNGIPLIPDKGFITAAISYQDAMFVTQAQHVIRKSTNGESWEQISDGLAPSTTSEMYLGSFAIHQDVLYFGTSKGIYQWNAAQQTWLALATTPFSVCPKIGSFKAPIHIASSGKSLYGHTACDGMHRLSCTTCPDNQTLLFQPLGATPPNGHLAPGGHHPLAMPYAISDQKVFRYDATDQTWMEKPLLAMPSWVDPKAHEVHTIGNIGYAFIETIGSDSWLIESLDSGDNWNVVYSMQDFQIDDLAAVKDRMLGLASTAGKFYIASPPYTDWHDAWIDSPAWRVCVDDDQVFVIAKGGALYKILVDNVLNEIDPRSEFLGNTPMGVGATPEGSSNITALFRHQGEFFVATSQNGVWRSLDGKTWQSASDGIAGGAQSFGAFHDDLYLGSGNTLYRWNPAKSHWALIASAGGDIEYLQSLPNALAAGVYNDGVYQLQCSAAQGTP